MGLRPVTFWLPFCVLWLCYGVPEAAADTKAANRNATQQDFWDWVATVEQNHQAYLAGAAAPTEDVTTLAASENTLYVGTGGYSSVQAAVDAVPSGGSRYTIQISSGTWG
jgi:pectin methylesterase-like acyl-CoA thioesterase